MYRRRIDEHKLAFAPKDFFLNPDELPDRSPSAFVAALKHMPARFTPVVG